MEVRERSAATHHIVQRKLIADAGAPGVAKPVRNRSNHGKVRTLRSARDDTSRSKVGRLVQYVRTLLKAVVGTKRHVRTETVLELNRGILIRLIAITCPLIKGEPRGIAQECVHSRGRLIQRDDGR